MDLDNFTLGDYSLIFSINDKSGNSIDETFSITITEETILPWIMRGNNLLIVTIASTIAIIFVIISFATLRGPIANHGWQDEIVAVSYTMKSGLNCVYIPYAAGLIEDEQLFGGAMTGIMGILEEITGEKDIQFSVQVVEFGDRKLLIYSGIYGDTILMVDKSKPTLKKRLEKFAREFESKYKEALQDQRVNPNDFRGVEQIVAKHFGMSKYLESLEETPEIDDLENSEENDEETETIDEIEVIEETSSSIEVISDNEGEEQERDPL